MDISITGLHIESDPKIKEYANQKIKKLIRYDKRITNIKVRLLSERSHKNEDHDFYCELTVHVPGKILEIVDREKNHTKAVDKAIERMKRALVKHKEKEISKQHRNGVFRKFLRRFKKS